MTLNLSSNNPFRNRATSPSPSALSANLSPTATSPFDDPIPRQRPVSRNPFLDPNYSTSQPNLIDTGSMSLKFDSKASPTAEELFVRPPTPALRRISLAHLLTAMPGHLDRRRQEACCTSGCTPEASHEPSTWTPWQGEHASPRRPKRPSSRTPPDALAGRGAQG